MKSLKQRALHWTRALHTYLTMFALVLLMFFSVTGFLMNHEDSFGLAAANVSTRSTKISPSMLKDKLMLVEYLRKNLGARGELVSFDDSGDPLRLQFTSPGRKIEYAIGLADGATEISGETRGLAGLVADLHSGKNVTTAWNLVIDGAAILLFLGSLSGAILWISMPKRRMLGIAAIGLSVALCVGVYVFLVP